MPLFRSSRAPVTIIVDTREQEPYSFDPQLVTARSPGVAGWGLLGGRAWRNWSPWSARPSMISSAR